MNTLDKQRFGPWALVTGASSGIGRAFAAHLAASGVNLVLAARRLSILDDVGRDLAEQYHIQYRSVQVNLAEPGFLTTLTNATDDLDLGPGRGDRRGGGVRARLPEPGQRGSERPLPAVAALQRAWAADQRASLDVPLDAAALLLGE